MTFLDIFLIFNALVVGAAATLGIQHAIAHFRPQKAEAKKVADNTPHLSPAAREQMVAEAEKKYQTLVNHTAEEFQKDLSATAGLLTTQLQKIGSKIVNDELEQYKNALRDMHVQADEAINGGRKDIETYREEMKKKLQEEVAAEKERMIAQIDTKLSDAIVAFLIETLQHDVDLGAQTAYLTKVLEEHKEEFKKNVSDES